MFQAKTQSEVAAKASPEPTIQQRPEPPKQQRAVARTGDVMAASVPHRGAAPRARLSGAMQRSVGNARLSRMLGAPVQARLTVGTPGDVYEQEAEHTADAVMRMGRAPAGRDAGGSAPPIRRAAAGAGLPEVTPELEQHIAATRGGGEPLPEAARRTMEPPFGADLGGVRVHRGPAAQRAARALDAQAFTTGRDIYFGAGRYQPGSQAGDRLLAHELTHVVQQGGGGVGAGGRLARQAQPKPGADALQPGGLAPGPHVIQGTRDEAQAALNTWELALQEAIGRLRRWLSHNMIRYLADLLQSGKGSQALEAIKGTFPQTVVEQVLGNLGSELVVEASARLFARNLARLFLSLRTARALGGYVSFIVGSIVEAVLSGLFDRSSLVIQATASEISGLVNDAINPVVDGRQRQLTLTVQQLRQALAHEALSPEAWRATVAEIEQGERQVSQIYLDMREESLYRQLSLRSEVYSGSEITAEQRRPVGGTGAGQQFEFTMQHQVVRTGKTHILVPRAGGTVMISCRSWDVILYEGEAAPVDVQGPDAAPSWRMTPPPREFRLGLYTSGLIGASSASVPRVFHVGREEFGVWYNLPKGTYMIEAWRAGYHPVALFAQGKIWVKS